MADFVGSVACPWRSLGMPRYPPSPGSEGRQTARPGNRKGHTMTEASVSFAGKPELRHTEAGIARAIFRVAVSGRRDQEASFFTVIVWRDQAKHAADSLSKGPRVVVLGRLSSGRGPLRMAAPAQSLRSWPRSWGRAFVGRRRRRPGRRGARTGSQLDQRCDGAGPGRSMLAFRSVVAVLLRAPGDFLYTLKAGLRTATTRREPGNRPHPVETARGQPGR
jgi:hypothetical protein